MQSTFQPRQWGNNKMAACSLKRRVGLSIWGHRGLCTDNGDRPSPSIVLWGERVILAVLRHDLAVSLASLSRSNDGSRGRDILTVALKFFLTQEWLPFGRDPPRHRPRDRKQFRARVWIFIRGLRASHIEEKIPSIGKPWSSGRWKKQRETPEFTSDRYIKFYKRIPKLLSSLCDLIFSPHSQQKLLRIA